jgi:serine/threonine protein kinase
MAGFSRVDAIPPTSAPLHSPPKADNLPAAHPPAVPDYELLRCIGRGSYGDVWLACNVLGQCRAVKFVYRSRFADPRPFEREFEGIQRFEPISRSHPSQLHILHVGKNDAAGCFYYVMELADDGAVSSFEFRVSGSTAATSAQSQLETPNPKPETYVPHTLRSDLEHHTRLPIPDCIQIGLSLATALAHLHEQDLVHRDIKPSNIIFVNGVAKLGDIGLVTDSGDTQSIVGTEGYLPPEGPGTPQADLYSLGKVLYEISTGLDRRRFAALPKDSWTWPDRDQLMEFNEIVLRACAKDPAQRYKTAEQLRADLALLQEGKSVRRARESHRVWARAKKLAAAVVLLGALAAGVAYVARQPQRTDVSGDGPPSTNELANAYCNKALMNLRGDNARGILEIYTNFHQAIALDRNFARPYVGLLELRLRENMPGMSYLQSEDLRTITQRLVELTPDSAAAHCGQSILNFFDWNYPGAERHARRSVELGPGYELGNQWYGFMLVHWGRSKEARRHLEVALRLNPSKVHIYRVLGHSYYAERNFPRAIEFYRQGINWEQHDLPCYIFMAYCYQAMGNYAKAIEVVAQQEAVQTGAEPKPGGRSDRLRQAFVRGGVRGYWEEELRLLRTNSFYLRAVAYQHLGETNAAFDSLERCYETHERPGNWIQDTMFYLLIEPTWDELRSHPRFLTLLEKVGYTKVMPAELLASIRMRAKQPE